MNFDELIIRSARGEATARERDRIEAWRRESPSNERLYRELFSLCELAGGMKPGFETTPVSGSTVIRRANERAGEKKILSFPRRLSIPHSVLLKAAAAAAVFMTTAGVVDWFSTRTPATLAETEPVRFETAADEQRTIELADGSLVHLGPSTVLEVIRETPDPELRLEGRAFFAVKRQENGRMRISTRAGTVAVLGTRFAMRINNDDLQLLVVDGRVAISAGAEEVEVGTSEMSLVNSGMLEAVWRVDDPLVYLAWMGSAMVFQDTPLDRAAREIAARYDVSIEIMDPGVGDRTVTAAFEKESVEEIISVVCGAVQVRCTIEDRTISVTRW